MGMFDDIRCEYPLPAGAPIDGYQTKSLDCALDLYVITADGQLLHQEYDTVDRSDPKAEGLDRMAGMLTRENQRMVPMPDYRGCVYFYTGLGRDDWYFSALFDKGRVLSIERL